MYVDFPFTHLDLAIAGHVADPPRRKMSSASSRSRNHSAVTAAIAFARSSGSRRMRLWRGRRSCWLLSRGMRRGCLRERLSMIALRHQGR